MTRDFDAIIIGAGQAGPSLAGRLTDARMTVALVERKLFGGTCVNTGCMPTKTLVASAYAAHLARRGAEYGVVLDGPVRIDMARVKARADAVSRNARTGVESWLRSMKGCTVLQGAARFESPDTLVVGDERLRAPRIYINVGGRAIVPDLPGIDRVSTLTNTSMLALDRVPEHLVVIGGSYIGLEFAQMYRRFGARVTIVEQSPRLVMREDEEVSAVIREILQGEGITVRTGAQWHSLRAARSRRCRRGRLHVRRTGDRGQPRPSGRGTSAQYGRPRARQGRCRDRPARLDPRRRSARDQRARHLGTW
jgi:pyruvate/2-oxoglutarate dehydrogenase complex dihydrolipoamide dehydrogenase (E3) component